MSNSLRLLPFLLLIFLSGTRAQDPVYRVYDRRDGLPSNTVYCAFQNANGFMWFGTDAGVCRFDGRNFRVFNVGDGMVDSEVLRIYQDSRGRVWFLTLKGLLCYYFEGRIHNPYNDPALPKRAAERGLLSFREDALGNLWFGGFGGQVIRYSPEGKADFIMTDSIRDPAIAGWVFLYEPEPGKVLVNRHSGLARIDAKTGSMEPVQIPEVGDTILWMDNTGNGKGMLVSARGLFRLDGMRAVRLLPADSIPERMGAGRISIDPDGSLWMMNNDKCVYYIRKRSGGGYEPMVRMFEGEFISRVFLDLEGNRWFTTISNGIYKTWPNNPQISARYIPSSENREPTRAVLLSHDGSCWIGTTNGHVFRLKDNRLTRHELIPDNPTINRVLCLLEDSLGNILCGGDRGLFFLKRLPDGSYANSREIQLEDEIEATGVKELFVDRRGQIRISTISGILTLEYRDGRYMLVREPGFPVGFRIYAPFADHANRIWFERFERLMCISAGRVREFPDLDSAFASRITAINETSDSCLLVGTYGKGLRVVRNGRVIHTANVQNTGLTGNICTRIVLRNGLIFLGTTNGVNILKWDGTRLRMIEKFANRDGLLNEETTDLAVDDHYIYLATPDGICTIDRRMQKTRAQVPIAYVTEFKIMGHEVDLTLPIVVQPDSNEIFITYVSPTFDQPGLMQFRYRFLPDDEKWSVTATTSLGLSDLEPGLYRFEVQARKFNSDWGPAAAVEFRILPPYFKTLGFRIGVLVVIVLFVVLFIRSIIAKRYQKQFALLREQQALEVERRRIGADMHDDLGADLTNILIYSKIISTAESLNERQRGALKKIGETSNDLINKMNEIIWALNPSNDTLDNLVAYLRQYAHEFSELHNLPLNIEAPSAGDRLIPIKAVLRRNLFLVMKEALRNVLRHAKAGQVTIRIIVTPSTRTLRMVIQDDGQGLDHAKPGKGNGLANMRKRIAEIGGTISIQPASPRGTCIDVSVRY